MVAFGIVALIFAVIGIFIPFAGVFLSGLSGFLAFFSAGKGTSIGLSAVIINIINILFLSPSLIISAADKYSISPSHAADSRNIFGFLITIQLVAITVFIIKKIMERKKKAVQNI